MRERAIAWSIMAAGTLILAASFVVGLRTRLFFNHVLFPLGFWLVFDAADLMLNRKSYFRRLGLREGLAMIALAGLFGVALDYHMVVLISVLKFYAIDSPFTALQMYVGWAFCLPAIYESYVVVDGLLPGKRRQMGAPINLGLVGALLLVIPIFCAMWIGKAPGWLLIPSFIGMFLILEYVQLRRGRVTLLESGLSRRIGMLAPAARPWIVMALASLPYTILWEGLNGMMGSWVYRNIFWLKPRIWNVPLVALFGYLFWYILFLSLLNALSERDLGVWTPTPRGKK